MVPLLWPGEYLPLTQTFPAPGFCGPLFSLVPFGPNQKGRRCAGTSSPCSGRPPPRLPSRRPGKLPQVANSASERLAGHACRFSWRSAPIILVIAFSTTDLDLIRGKGIQAPPLVDVEVPSSSFLRLRLFSRVLIHFNLSVFNSSSSPVSSLPSMPRPRPPQISAAWRDRLHIFPYTYYLFGRPAQPSGAGRSWAPWSPLRRRCCP